MVARTQIVSVRKIVGLSEGLAHQIEDFRFKHRFKAETDAIRVLIEAGLKAFEGKAARDGA